MVCQTWRGAFGRFVDTMCIDIALNSPQLANAICSFPGLIHVCVRLRQGQVTDTTEQQKQAVSGVSAYSNSLVCLARLPKLTKLELIMVPCDVSARHVHAPVLRPLTLLKRLELLHVFWPCCPDELACVLRHLTRLTELRIGDRTLRAEQHRLHMPMQLVRNLHRLQVFSFVLHRQHSDSTLYHLAYVRNLTCLDIGEGPSAFRGTMKFTPGGLRAIAALSGLTHLGMCALCRIWIGDGDDWAQAWQLVLSKIRGLNSLRLISTSMPQTVLSAAAALSGLCAFQLTIIGVDGRGDCHPSLVWEGLEGFERVRDVHLHLRCNVASLTPWYGLLDGMVVTNLHVDELAVFNEEVLLTLAAVRTLRHLCMPSIGSLDAEVAVRGIAMELSELVHLQTLQLEFERFWVLGSQGGTCPSAHVHLLTDTVLEVLGRSLTALTRLQFGYKLFNTQTCRQRHIGKRGRHDVYGRQSVLTNAGVWALLRGITSLQHLHMRVPGRMLMNMILPDCPSNCRLRSLELCMEFCGAPQGAPCSGIGQGTQGHGEPDWSALARSLFPTTLQSLSLALPGIGDDAVAHFARRLPCLTHLGLLGTHCVTASGLSVLRHEGLFTALRRLSLENIFQERRAGMQAVLQSWPELWLDWV